MINTAGRWPCLYALSCLLALPCLARGEDTYPSPAPGNSVVRTIPFKAGQGVAVDENYFYAISNTEISKCHKSTGKVISEWKADIKNEAYQHFKHLNSGTVVEGRLYCAHSRYGIDPNDNTIEIWNVEKERLDHEKTIRLPRKYGSLTWIDRDRDHSWWMCFAVYGKDKNKDTTLVKYQCKNGEFVEARSWTFPEEAIGQWGEMSCSGGSWGPDGYLYTTGHDHMEAYVLEADKAGKLRYVRTEQGVGFFGQAIAWDRFSKEPILWGIVKNKNISLTLIPTAAP